MADVKWIKLNTHMFDDEKIKLIESMPEADTILIIWIKLLNQAGKTNASGYIFLNENIPYTDEMLSTLFNRPLNLIRLALRTFQDFGMIEIDNHSFISITNWEKHQNIEGLNKIREDTRKRVQKHRENKKLASNEKCNVTVTQGNATELELELELDKEKEVVVVNPFQFYEQNFGVIGSFIGEQIDHWISDIGKDLVIEAMKKALKQQKKWNYAEGILKQWANEGLKTISDIEAAEKQFQKKGVKNEPNKKPSERSDLTELDRYSL